MVTRLRNINPVQFGLVYGIITGIIGFVIALLALPFSAMMAASGAPGAQAFGAGMGVMFIVIAPIMYFCIGFVGGLLTSFVYNIVAGWTGGVEITLSTTAGVPAAPPASGYSV